MARMKDIATRWQERQDLNLYETPAGQAQLAAEEAAWRQALAEMEADRLVMEAADPPAPWVPPTDEEWDRWMDQLADAAAARLGTYRR